MEHNPMKPKSKGKAKYEITYKSSDGVDFSKKDGIRTGCNYRSIEENRRRIKEFQKEIKDVENLIKIHARLFKTKKTKQP